MEADGDYNPSYFPNEEALFEAIREVKEKKGEEDDTVMIKYNRREENRSERYSANWDRNKLASITSFYRPVYVLEGMSLGEITVIKGVVSYRYFNDDYSDTAFFSLVIGRTPDFHMNASRGHGAVAEREVEHNGITYLFLDWMDPETGGLAGHSIVWVVDERCYKASITSGYTDEEMLAFCQFEVVVVE